MIKRKRLDDLLYKNLTTYMMALGNKEKYMTLIYKSSNLSVDSINRLTKELEKEGFIKTRKQGRLRFVSLTSKGKILYKAIKSIE